VLADGAHHLAELGAVLRQQRVGRRRHSVRIKTAGGRKRPLRIEIDQQDVLAAFSQRRAQVNHGSGLPDAALLVGNGQDVSHQARV
jgi:hypothetical protein